MKIDLSGLEQEPLSFDERLTVDSERLDTEGVTTAIAVHLEGEVRPDGDAVTVFGRFRAEGELACSRCLEKALWKVDEPFSVDYRRLSSAPLDDEVGLEEDDLDVSFLDGEELDLLELAAEQVLLTLPMRILCDENCAGLCPTCGANRNREAACNCPPEVDPRWKALEGLAGSGSES